MKLKIILLVFTVFLGFMILSLKTISVTNLQSSNTIYSEEWATLLERVQKAKELGKNKVIFPAPIGIPTYVENLSEAIDKNRIIVVQPIIRKSYPQGEMDIITWHKFRIIEELSPGRDSNTSLDYSIEALPEEIDGDLLPVEDNEILVRQAGGILNIDGITLIQETAKFPLLSNREKYLLFISKNSSQKVGRIGLGPYGVFAISHDNLLIPLVKSQHPIGRDIKRNFRHSLDRLKMNLNKPSFQN
jgi:hypothetical protein